VSLYGRATNLACVLPFLLPLFPDELHPLRSRSTPSFSPFREERLLTKLFSVCSRYFFPRDYCTSADLLLLLSKYREIIVLRFSPGHRELLEYLGFLIDAPSLFSRDGVRPCSQDYLSFSP